MSVRERSEQLIDLRCPVGPRQLLARVVANNEKAPVTSDNLLELVCRDCGRMARRKNSRIARVVHRFNVLGELIESVATERD